VLPIFHVRTWDFKREREIEEFAGLSCRDRVIVARLHLTFLNCRVTMGFFYIVFKKFKEKKRKVIWNIRPPSSAVRFKVLKFRLVWWVDSEPGRSKIGTEPGLIKNRKSHDPMWPGDLVDPTKSGKKHGCNPLTLFFILLKRHRFEFF
jgi:hypothetical protein